MRRLPALALLGAALSAASVAPASAQTLNGRFLDAAVDSIATAHLETGQVAGFTVAVARGGTLLHHEPYGHADLELGVRTPRDAVYEIGSVTKQFTAVLVLQEVEKGTLDLDADIRDYLPDFDTGGRTVPLRRLLDHTSGMKGYTEMPIFGGLIRQALRQDTLVALVENAEWDFEPGSAVIYNNSAYFLAGLILEEVTGESYEELVQALFDAHGMEDSFYCSNSRVVSNRAKGYDAIPDGFQRTGFLDHRWPYAAGSLCSTAGDLIRWNQALHRGEVLSPETYELLITPEPLADGTPTRYAKGLGHYESAHGRLITHGGGINGFLSEGFHFPDEELTVVVLQNTTGPAGPGAVAAGVIDLLLPESSVEDVAFEGDPASLAGTYRGPSRGRAMEVEIFVEDGELMARVNGQEDADTFRSLGDGIFAPPASDGFGARIYFVDTQNRVVGTPGAGRPVAVRYDAPGAHYVLPRQN